MTIPQLSQAVTCLCSGIYALYTVFCSATNAFRLILSVIIEKVRFVASPILNPRDVAENGSVGQKPFASNVRMVFVNGVATSLDKCRRTANSISRIFNDCCIHYTYIPLRYDQVVRTIMYGHRPLSCNLLLANIRERLQELSTTQRPPSAVDTRVCTASLPVFEQKPKLVVFVHSGGGAMLEAIRNELTLEERELIQVYSFGSAHLFSQEEGFGTVKNAVASGDPVPAVCRFVDRRIRPLGEPWTIGTPALFNLSNHSILNDMYQLAMWHIRENYLASNCKSS